VDPYRASVDELPLREYYPQERTRRRISRRPAVPVPVAAGETVLERYLLVERLGAGGFGVVWCAHDELLDRDVAVKRIPLGDEDDGERASREAMACARLAHPSIVALYEASAVDDAFFLISELVDGETLAQHIAGGALHDAHVLEIGLSLTQALEHAHERGVIHRDIKPQNVLVPTHAREAGAAAKLADFGGASLVGEDALTRTGDVLGTLAYMAPEQVEGGEVGEEADLYSLALVLYEALAGVNPVRGPTPAATARRIGRRLAPLSRVRRDLPADLTRAVDRALEPSPADRGSVEDLHEAIDRAVENPPSRTRRRLPRARQHPRERTAREPRGGGELHLPERTETQHAAEPAAQPRPQSAGRRLSLPRTAWLACAAAAIGWEAAAGRSGTALLLLAALAPLLLLPRDRDSTGVGAGWLTCALAPALGLAGLAAAFPAVAGQATSWRDRGARGALGYWWLVLAEVLVGRTLWLGSGTAARHGSAWESSASAAASHALAPVLTVAVLLGAEVWAAGSIVLPWLVRGRSAILDLIAAALWSAAIAVASVRLDGGLTGHPLHTEPRGLILGAVLGGMLAVAARALRGPV
jgi:serine/threonine protein kinase